MKYLWLSELRKAYREATAAGCSQFFGIDVYRFQKKTILRWRNYANGDSGTLADFKREESQAIAAAVLDELARLRRGQQVLEFTA